MLVISAPEKFPQLSAFVCFLNIIDVVVQDGSIRTICWRKVKQMQMDTSIWQDTLEKLPKLILKSTFIMTAMTAGGCVSLHRLCNNFRDDGIFCGEE